MPLGKKEYAKAGVVGVERFELPTSWSQTRRATRLRYTPNVEWLPELDLNQRPID